LIWIMVALRDHAASPISTVKDGDDIFAGISAQCRLQSFAAAPGRWSPSK